MSGTLLIGRGAAMQQQEIQVDVNLFVVTTDWHVRPEGTSGGVGEVFAPGEAQEVVSYINSLTPVGAVDLGDLTDNFGNDAPQLAEFDAYVTYVLNAMPWAAVNAGDTEALAPVLPGNHDETQDVGAGTATDFTPFNSKLWGPPYHWTADWDAPQVRFIGFHATINHTGTLQSFASVDTAERVWLEDELDALPAGWKAIVCCHFPILTTFGNHIRAEGGQTDILNSLAGHASQVAAVMTGHRHQNFGTAVQDGITHMSLPAMSYTAGNSSGGFVPITYDPVAETLTFEYKYGPPDSGDDYPGFTSPVISIGADVTGPAGVAIVLDGGAATTPDELVSAAVTTTDVNTTGYEVKFWGDVAGAANEAAAAWIPLASPHGVTVTSGDGTKTVNTRMRDADDNESDVASDTIELAAAPTWEPDDVTDLMQWGRPRTWGLSDGTAVASAPDDSPADNDLAQATSASQPLKQSVNGVGVLRFDGSNDFISKSFVLAQPLTYFAVVKFNAAFAANAVIMDGTAGNNALFYRLGSNSLGLFAGTNMASTGYTPEVWHYYVCQFNGASSFIRADGTQITSGNAGTATPGGLTIGRQVGGAAPANIDIAEWGVYQKVLTTQERTDLETYLADLKASL